MNRQTIRVVTGANLLAGCLLLQGCGMFGHKKAPGTIEPLPADNTAVEVQPVDATTPAPAPTVRVATPEPIQLPEVPMSTPYSIRKGDTISGVAYRYGLRWQDVVAVNPGINPTRLRIGQIIQLPGQVNLGHPVARPAATGRRTTAPRMTAPKTSKASAPTGGKTVTYVVRSGDSLSAIAYRFGVRIADIRSANNLKGDRINAGQKLKIINPKKSSPGSSSCVKSAPRKHSAANVKAPAIKSRSSASASKPAPATKAEPKATTPAATAAPAKVEEKAAAPEAKAAVPAVKPATPPLDVYTVKEGEDLYAIAIRWGVTPSKLRELNNLSVDADLKPGQTLKIPPQAQ